MWCILARKQYSDYIIAKEAFVVDLYLFLLSRKRFAVGMENDRTVFIGPHNFNSKFRKNV